MNYIALNTRKSGTQNKIEQKSSEVLQNKVIGYKKIPQEIKGEPELGIFKRHFEKYPCGEGLLRYR